MHPTVYNANALTGGSPGALDAIDPGLLKEDDRAIALVASGREYPGVHFYRYDPEAMHAVDPPYVVAPTRKVYPLFTVADDPFDGVNGAPPDSLRWRVIGGTPTIQGDKCRIRLTSGVWDGFKSTFTIQGDFDIRIDWYLPAFIDVIGWYHRFVVMVDINNLIDFGIGYNQSQRRYVRYTKIAGIYDGGVQVQYTNAAGRLRITRSGLTWRTYRADIGTESWVEHSTPADVGNGDVFVQNTYSYWSDATTLTIDLNNFQVVQGTLMPPLDALSGRWLLVLKKDIS